MGDLKQNLSWGIIGCGAVTEKKSGPAAFNVPHQSELIAVMRRDASLAADYAARHGIAHSYGSAEELLGAGCNAVYIATPPGSHVELARLVAASGKPLYLEKPMARNLAESQAIADEFKKRNLPLFVAYYRRAYPRFVNLRHLLYTERAIGQVTSVTYRHTRFAPPVDGAWRHSAAASGGGLFVDVGSHALDLFDYLFGPLQQVRGVARGAAGHVETRVSATFGFASGGVGMALWDFAGGEGGEEDTLTIRGTAGTITLPELMNGDTTLIAPSGKGATATKLNHPPPATVQQPMLATVIEALRSGQPSRCPSGAESALRTAAAIDAILSEYYGGRADAFWERPSSWGAPKEEL